MPDYLYGFDGSSVVTDEDGNVFAGRMAAVYTAQAGGVAFTATKNVVPVTGLPGAASAGVVTADAGGCAGFYATDYRQTLYLDFGSGRRWPINPTREFDLVLSVVGEVVTGEVATQIAASPAVTAAAAAAVQTQLLNFTAPSKNLFDPTKGTTGYGLNITTGAVVVSASYTATDYMPVTAGVPYTLTNPRGITFYGPTKTFLAGTGIDNASQLSVTTTPTTTGFMRASVITTNLGSFQVEQAAASTMYTRGGIVMPTLEATATAGIALGLATVPINADRTTFIAPVKNLHNPATASPSTYLDSLGVTTNASYTTTDYIPVVAGQAYTLSNPRNVGFYDVNRSFRPWVTVANGANTVLTVTPTVSGFMRASYITATYGATFQVEKGSSATAYAAYALTAPLLDASANAAAALAASTGPVAPERATFLVASKNLYNPATATAGYLVQSSGLTAVAAAYTTTDYIPVVAGQAYTVSNGRAITVYDASKVNRAGEYYNNVAAGTPAYTFTPTVNGFMRTSFNTALYTSNFQVEKGGAATGFAAYGFTFPLLTVPTVAPGADSGPVSLTRTGSSLSIASTVGATGALVINAGIDSSNNGAFNFASTTLDGVAIHANGDDVTPIRTQLATVGANHGYPCVASFANPDAKATADLGSIWTDGTRQYVLLAITGGLLIVGGSYISTAGVITSVTVAPTANLTHVSGATHTAAMVYTTQATAQLYPSTGRIKVGVFCDGQPVTANGTVKGRRVEVRETYDIYDYADLYDKAKANIGVSYSTLSPAACIRMANVFTFSAGGRVEVRSELLVLTPTTLGSCGFLQSIRLTKTGATVKRYLPGVKPISGIDFTLGVDLDSYASSLLVTNADLLIAGRPPTFALDRIIEGGVTTSGFAMGYLPFGTDNSTMAARVAGSTSNYWDLRDTDKSYPQVITGTTNAAVGARFTMRGFRSYLSAAQVDAVVAAGPDALGAWNVLDSVAALTA